MIVREHLYGDELLAAVFAQWPVNTRFEAVDHKIVGAFYKASKKKKYAELFENYVFDNPEPKSGIHEALLAFCISGLIGTYSGVRVEYELTPEIRSRYEYYIRDKCEDQEDLVRELAKEIAETLNVQM